MISEILRTGAENATSASELCQRLQLTPRRLSAQVMRERRQGKPICASVTRPQGYFLAANKAEMLAYCGRLWHRAGEIHKTRRACLKCLESLPGEEGNE